MSRLVNWTKGFKCAGVEGQDVVGLLHQAVLKQVFAIIICCRSIQFSKLKHCTMCDIILFCAIASLIFWSTGLR